MEELRKHIEALQRQWARTTESAQSAGAKAVGSSLAEGPRVAWVEGPPLVSSAPPPSEGKPSASLAVKESDQDEALEAVESGFKAGAAHAADGRSVRAGVADGSRAEAKAEAKSTGAGVAVEEAFPVGCEVRVTGVQARPELNGRRGVVVEAPAPQAGDQARLGVVLRAAGGDSPSEEWGEEFKFKTRNLERVDGAFEPDASLALEARAAARAKRGGALEARAAEREAMPLVLFCQPVPLEQLVSSVLAIAEYPTFSLIMRMKVKAHDNNNTQ
jgi:hypothetical protein